MPTDTERIAIATAQIEESARQEISALASKVVDRKAAWADCRAAHDRRGWVEDSDLDEDSIAVLIGQLADDDLETDDGETVYWLTPRERDDLALWFGFAFYAPGLATITATGGDDAGD